MFKVHIDTQSAIQMLRTTLDSGYLNEGEQVYDLRDWLKKYFNEKNIVLTNSCTSALTMALILSGVKTSSRAAPPVIIFPNPNITLYFYNLVLELHKLQQIQNLIPRCPTCHI